MKEEDFVQEFIEKMKHTDFSSESGNKAANLEALRAKLPIINQEGRIFMKEGRRGIRKPIAIAACVAILLSMSAVVFGQDIVNYIRTTVLGEFAVFVTGPELPEEELQIAQEEARAMIDTGEIAITVTTQDEQRYSNWLTFTDPEEGKSHFITNVMLPTYAPDGFDFKHIFYYVETREDLAQPGANK
ncbi:MAG: hypothetical protein LBE55_06600 [Clostridiales bacterium]|jgi:hypothetical protein|nr:hypothetical protein [Clostridiales bacterium]